MFSLVIQAGGESRRMGQDKALLPFLGQPLIARVINRLSHLADEVLITTNNPAPYAFLGLPLYRDRLPGRGALGGVYTALDAARGELVALVACDMPFANATLLAAQRDILLDEGCDAVIPRQGKYAEPFHAVYRRQTCLPAVQRAIESDKWRVDAWFAQVAVRYLDSQEIRRFDPAQRAFMNVNTPEEWAIAEQLARDDGETRV